MKKMYYLIIPIALALFVYKVIGWPAINPTIGKEFDPYHYLSENTTETEHYKIQKLDFNYPESIYIWGIKNTPYFIIETTGPKREKIIKINSKGVIVDSLLGKMSVRKKGVFFYDDYYIDWMVTRDKTKHPYANIINYDDLSEKDFLALLKDAEDIHFGYEYTNSYKQKGGWCFFKKEGKWGHIFSEKFLDKLDYLKNKDFGINHPNDEDNDENFLTWKEKELHSSSWATSASYQVFKKVKNVPLRSHKLEPIWVDNGHTKQTAIFQLKAFVKKSKSRKSFYDINNHSRSGWNGTGYFDWPYKSDTFQFKAYAFGGTDVDFHISQPKAQDLDDITFLQQYNYRTDKIPNEVGLYVVIKK